MIATLAAGCNQAGSSAAGGPVCATSPGVSAHQLKLGIVYPVTGGDQSAFGPYRAGVEARIGLANAGGGVNGRTIVSTWADDEGQAATNLGVAQQLVNFRKVFGLVELTAASQGSAKWLHGNDIPVTGTSLDLAWATYKNMFSYANFVTNSGAPSAWGEYERAAGAHRAAVLYSSGADVSLVMAKRFADSLAAAGIPSDFIEASPENDSEQQIADQVNARHDDLITGLDDTDMTLTIAVLARAKNPAIRILSGTAYDPAVLDQGGAALAGMDVFVDYVPFELPVAAHATFLAAMARYSPEQQPAANEIALQGWLGADVMIRGLQAAGPCPTRQSFITNLRNVTNYNAGGLLAKPISMKTIFGETNECFYFLRVNATGTKYVPTGKVPRCGHVVRTSVAGPP